MEKASATINANNVFYAVAYRTEGYSRYFTTFNKAIEVMNEYHSKNSYHIVEVVQLTLSDDEYVPTAWYETGTLAV